MLCMCDILRVHITLMYSGSSSSSSQAERLCSTMRWNSDAPCAWRKAASDVFLDGLNNECLKRVLGPQLPNLPLSSALTCSSGTRLEKEGKEECVSTSAEATCCLLHRLSLGIAKDHKHVTSGLRLFKAGRIWLKLMSFCFPTLCEKLTWFPFCLIIENEVHFSLYFFVFPTLEKVFNIINLSVY